VMYDSGLGTEALAFAIADLMDNPTKRRELGACGWSAVHASFTDKNMAEQTWELYERYRETAGGGHVHAT